VASVSCISSAALPSTSPAARAVAQTKMTISQRARVEDVLCDVVCTGRFYDFFEKRDSRWGLVLRQPIYEKDRLDPVDPAARLALEPGLLAQFPEGYRHLAYLQTRIGYKVKPRHARPRRPGGRSPLSPRRALAAGRQAGVRPVPPAIVMPYVRTLSHRAVPPAGPAVAAGPIDGYEPAQDLQGPSRLL
jgi:hypothetical protein